MSEFSSTDFVAPCLASSFSIAEKSRRSRCISSRSFGCRCPVALRPIERTLCTSGSSRHSRKTPCPTIPVAPKRRTFICSPPPFQPVRDVRISNLAGPLGGRLVRLRIGQRRVRATGQEFLDHVGAPQIRSIVQCALTAIGRGIDVLAAVQQCAHGGQAAVHGRLTTVRALLDGGEDVNATPYCRQSALHYAAYLGRTDVVEELLARGADTDRKSTRLNSSH